MELLWYLAKETGLFISSRLASYSEASTMQHDSVQLSLYQDLSNDEKQVMDIISIIYEASHKTKLIEVLRRAQMRFDGRAVSQNIVTPIFSKLQKLQLIDNTYRCAPGIREWIMNVASQKADFPKQVEAVREILNARWYSDYTEEHYFRELRIGLYQNDAMAVRDALHALLRKDPQWVGVNNPLIQLLEEFPDQSWLQTRSVPIQLIVIEAFLEKALLLMEPVDSLLEELQSHLTSDQPHSRDFAADLLLPVYLLQGRLSEVEALLSDSLEEWGLPVAGSLAFLTGENETALHCFEQAMDVHKKEAGQRDLMFKELEGLFYLLALFKTQDVKQYAKIQRYLNNYKKYPRSGYTSCYLCLEAYLAAQKHKLARSDELLREATAISNGEVLKTLFHYLVDYWVKSGGGQVKLAPIQQLINQALQNQYDWFALEFAELFIHVTDKHQKNKKLVDELMQKTGLYSILHTVNLEAGWERTLKALGQISKVDSSASERQENRLIWLVDLENHNFSPRLQKRTKSGGWSKGRPVALKRLAQGESIDGLTDQDHRIGQTLKMEYSYYGTEYFFQNEKTLKAMVGHPFLFLENSLSIPIELIKGQPELWIEEEGNQYQVRFSIEPTGGKVLIVRETPTRYKLIDVSTEHRKIAEILQGGRVNFPKAAKSKLADVVSRLSSITTVHSTLEADTSSMKSIAGESKPCVHLFPLGDGFKAEIFVRPFAKEGNYYKPGKGGSHVFTEIKGKQVQAKRNLQEEKVQTKTLLGACPSLSPVGYKNLEWVLDDPESCLEVLLELDEVKEQLTLEWPEGEKLRVSHRVSLDQMRMRIRKEQDWFSLSGEVQLDNDLVLDMKELLEMIEKSPGRFVALSDGEFIALTDSFRQRLGEIHALSNVSEEGVHFHPLASLALQNITEGVGKVKKDRAWNQQIKRIQEAQAFEPQIPSTLQAELRDYQVDGFQWLSQLAYLGVGACLADDMGLGKTIQVLSVLLTRAQQGPALVVAPTSVCFNWLHEATRFAPTLKPFLFGGKNRITQVEQLESFDLMICSYGLLQQESELLASVKWHTVILDEAQAIKNRNTKRSKAAMALKGDLRIVTTGTPIENHLGELWNLMQFVNPGLLGTLDQFNERFAAPIEKHQDAHARKCLKQLIQPFILRRTKTQVLDELPPRTEIVLHVEMTPQEKAFYEALRRKAVSSLEKSDADAQQHLQILAELMRLRRACCNPQLIDPQVDISSSKLALFENVVEELLENHHKALVFSQFVGHLTLIRELLDQKGISYCYLDGSTPQKKRQAEIDAFQAGETDLFLISLKAGGVGLNLTAADYVIHMDPWWNPAVEDQASDRAHRIGQKRPVTIYRLVTKGTIEEKIVDLHHHKRDLADSLLQGSEMSGKLSSEQLLRLIQEG